MSTYRIPIFRLKLVKDKVLQFADFARHERRDRDDVIARIG